MFGLCCEFSLIIFYRFGSLTFGDLTLNQNGADTDIIETATNETLATLIGIDAVTINNSEIVILYSDSKSPPPRDAN